MSDQAEVPSISMGNTKKEMLQAYQEMKALIEQQQAELMDAEKSKRQLEKELATSTAEEAVKKDPVQRITQLRTDIGKKLGELAGKYENELDNYKSIKSAVTEKEKELKTLYEIETAASDLAALIDAQRKKKQEFEEEIQKKRQAWEEEQQDQAKKRQREKEEYEYQLKREQEQKENALKDRLNNLEKELQAKKEEFNKEIAQREESLKSREKELADLRAQVDTFPKTVEQEVQQAVDKNSATLKQEHARKEELLQTKYEGEKNLLQSKIESLQETVKSQMDQIKYLSDKQEKAYEKVQDIASKAVASAKREFVTLAEMSKKEEQK